VALLTQLFREEGTLRLGKAFNSPSSLCLGKAFTSRSQLPGLAALPEAAVERRGEVLADPHASLYRRLFRFLGGGGGGFAACASSTVCTCGGGIRRWIVYCWPIVQMLVVIQ